MDKTEEVKVIVGGTCGFAHSFTAAAGGVWTTYVTRCETTKAYDELIDKDPQWYASQIVVDFQRTQEDPIYAMQQVFELMAEVTKRMWNDDRNHERRTEEWKEQFPDDVDFKDDIYDKWQNREIKRILLFVRDIQKKWWDDKTQHWLSDLWDANGQLSEHGQSIVQKAFDDVEINELEGLLKEEEED